MTDNFPYEDIVALPHHQSASRLHMSSMDRAAQFAPFSALTGYGEVVKEEARLTDTFIDLDEYEKVQLDDKLQYLQDHLSEQVSISYFRPDERKDGGSYETVTGAVKRFDLYGQQIIMRMGEKIPIENIIEIEGDIFESMTEN